MKKLLCFVACLVVASQPVMAQAGGPPAIIVQLYYTGINTGHLAITRGPGKTEDVEFKVTNLKEHGAAEAYQRVFAQLNQEGYTLKSTFGPGDSSHVTFVFEKKP